MSSVTWYGLPEGKTAADYQGLVGDDVKVKNRYIMPIGNSTIADSNGTLQNSYGW